MASQSHEYKVGDKVYVDSDPYDQNCAVGSAVVTKVFPRGDYDTFIEVQFTPELVTIGRVQPSVRP